MAESLETESFEVADDDFSALSPDDDDATTPLRPIPEEEEEEEEERKEGENGVGNGGNTGAKTGSAIRNKWQKISERSLERGSNGIESGSVEDSITSTGSGWNPTGKGPQEHLRLLGSTQLPPLVVNMS